MEHMYSSGRWIDYLASVVRVFDISSHFTTININASNFTNAGADVVTELAFGISMGNDIWHSLLKGE